jgi:sugar/nucleoside kinase (ribokinase family)
MSPASWPFPISDRSGASLDVVCVGNALVDRFAETHDGVVVAAGLEPGAMTLVDAGEAAAIERSYTGWAEVAGGSAANTAAGLASLGGAVGFVGAVGADEVGRTFISDLEAIGVRCVAHRVSTGTPTGVCHVFVEEDGRRTMATFLGACSDIATAAVDEAELDRSAVVYLEGYLLDAPNAADALARATEVARRSGTIVALSLSDPFVVERHFDRILGLVEDGSIDLLLGNEDEAYALTGHRSLEDVAARLDRPGLAFVVTRGADGSAVLTADGIETVDAEPVDAVVDTTGAGDLFAAGVLYGLTHGESPEGCLRLGSITACEVISHIGARPRTSLAALAKLA